MGTQTKHPRRRMSQQQQRVAVLVAEQQAIYRAAMYRAVGLTGDERFRLDEIAGEIALLYEGDDTGHSGNAALYGGYIYDYATTKPRA